MKVKGIQKYELTVLIEKNLSTNERKLKKEIERSDEVFIHHYRNTYRHPPSPPIWAVSEIMSLGTLSRWVTHMVPSDRAALARTYGLDQGGRRQLG